MIELTSDYSSKQFCIDVRNAAFYLIDRTSADLRNGAVYANEIMTDYFKVDRDINTIAGRGDVMNSIGAIANKSTRTLRTVSLDFRLGMILFAESIATVAANNCVIDSIDLWTVDQLLESLRTSYILQA